MRFDPALGLTIALVLAGIFAAAAIAKLRALEAFGGVVRNYRIVPDLLAPLVTKALPAIELAISIGLVLPRSRPAAAAAAAVLLLVFGAAIAVNLRRGRREIDCGCFIGLLRQRLSWILVGRNGVLAAAAALLAFGTVDSRALTLLDGLTVVGAGGSVLLLYAALDRLHRSAPTLRPATTA